VKINVGELFRDEVKQAGFLEAVNLGVKLETFKIPRTAGENA
jgi:hypothetical protein